MSTKIPSRVRVTSWVLAALLWLPPMARADTVTKGRIFADASRGGALDEKGTPWFDRPLLDKLDALDFPQRVLTHIEPWTLGTPLRIPPEVSTEFLEKTFTSMEFNRVKEHYFRPKPDNRLQPGTDFGVNLMGVTGMLTMPNSFVLPKGTWAVGLTYLNEELNSRAWPAVYQNLESDAVRLHVNHGFKDNFEAGLILHRRDSDITYTNQGGGPVRFQDDYVVGGLSFKGAIPTHDRWMSAGFSFDRVSDEDRSLQDLRTYDYTSSAFFTISDGGRRWDGTLSMKYIKYARNSKRPPVGASATSAGFSPQGDWAQLGLGYEYGRWGGFSGILEATERHRIDFVGIREREFNFGVKYKTKDFEVKAYKLKFNVEETDQIGFTATLRFD